jgi:hypothetical protein
MRTNNENSPDINDDKSDILAVMEENRQKLQLKKAQMSLIQYKDFKVEKEKSNQQVSSERERYSQLSSHHLNNS